jgi:hypothetical protein
MNRLIKAARRSVSAVPDAKHELPPAEYEQIICRLREIVVEKLPLGARLLVVSRGDDRLVRFDDREAWHFPRADTGKYAGYHPDNSEDAVEHLKELQDAGAQYLLVPRPSFWWLDYYSGLFQYLAQWGSMIWDDEACVIFELQRAAGGAAPFKRLLEALLPRETRVAVLTSGDSRLLAVDGRMALHFPHGSGGRYHGDLDASQALKQLAELRSKGVEYLVVPHVAPSWLDSHPDFLAKVQAKYGMLARRKRVCTVYALNAPPGLASRSG